VGTDVPGAPTRLPSQTPTATTSPISPKPVAINAIDQQSLVQNQSSYDKSKQIIIAVVIGVSVLVTIFLASITYWYCFRLRNSRSNVNTIKLARIQSNKKIATQYDSHTTSTNTSTTASKTRTSLNIESFIHADNLSSLSEFQDRDSGVDTAFADTDIDTPFGATGVIIHDVKDYLVI